MARMKTWMKILSIIIVLAIIASFLLLRSLRDEPYEDRAESIAQTTGSPAFEMRVIMPRIGLPFGGLLPDWVVKKMDGTPRQLGFDSTSAGAVGSAGKDRLTLTADGGWDFSIETDSAGAVAQGTRFVFPLGLGGRRLKLRCRPADPAKGYFKTTTRAGSEDLNGRFLVELVKCENAESGKMMNWPPAALTVRGGFAGMRPARP